MVMGGIINHQYARLQMKRLFIYLSLITIGVLIPLYAHSVPKFLRLSYTGDTSTTMTVVWNTDVDTESIVIYGKAPGNYSNNATGTSFKANGALNYIHEVTLTGLEPNTIYYYKAGSNSDGFSEERSFKTGPVQDTNCGRFSFGYLGDNRPDPTFGGGENWPQILGQAAKANPDFMINGGDLVIDGDKIDEWIKFLGWTENVASRIPLMPTIGNHDDGPGTGDSANYNQIFALPRSTGVYGSNTEDYYYFTYGNAIFVSLSTQTFRDGDIPFERQAKWLDEVLTNNPRKWKFVYYHHPSYTKNVVFDISHPPNEVNQNGALVPIFDKHHVDIVFTSHNHWYERYEPSACSKLGNPSSSTPCSVGANNFDKGTVFVVSGGAGAFTIPGILCGKQDGRVQCSGDHHYIIISINNETLTYEAYSAYPQQNKVMDTFTITKTKDNCVILNDAGMEDITQDSGLIEDAGKEIITDTISIDTGILKDVAEDREDIVDSGTDLGVTDSYQDTAGSVEDVPDATTSDISNVSLLDIATGFDIKKDLRDTESVNEEAGGGCGCLMLY
jgi:hypothetical protein